MEFARKYTNYKAYGLADIQLEKQKPKLMGMDWLLSLGVYVVASSSAKLRDQMRIESANERGLPEPPFLELADSLAHLRVGKAVETHPT